MYIKEACAQNRIADSVRIANGWDVWLCKYISVRRTTNGKKNISLIQGRSYSGFWLVHDKRHGR